MTCSTFSRCSISSRSAGPLHNACQKMFRCILVRRPVMMLSSVDMPWNNAMFWKVRAMPCLAIWCGFIGPRFRPWNQTSPSCG